MRVFVLLLLSICLISCSDKPEFTTISGNTMGTYYIVKIKGLVDKKALEMNIQTLLNDLNKVFSTYDTSSELSKINQSKETSNEISSELEEVLVKALEVSKQAEGYFDVTVGPIVNAWGFGPGGIKRRRPQPKEIDELMNLIGHEKLSISNKKLTRPIGTYIDLSSIAKGYAVDKVFDFLKKEKHSSFLVEIGGEVRTFGRKSKDEPWKIGVEAPEESKGNIQRVIPLENQAIATSGSYRNYRKYGNKVFSHTIDPKTGYPVDHQLISVSVISKDCMEADAWATALLALGPEKGYKKALEKGLSAYFMLKEGEKILTKSSGIFEKVLRK